MLSWGEAKTVTRISRQCSCSNLSSAQSFQTEISSQGAFLGEGRAEEARERWQRENGAWKEGGRMSKPVGLEFEAVCRFHLESRRTKQENQQKALSYGPGSPGSGLGMKVSWGGLNIQYAPKQCTHCAPHLLVGQNLWTCWLPLSALAQH